ncbi:Gfo/Idh/MocA family oxidoreductase [bacterium]|nr:Gfo/Idh/MocA family oxidoreductase [bacterium]
MAINVTNPEDADQMIIAQIGVGYWGPNLLRNLIANDKCFVKIVVDTSDERRDFVKRYFPSVDVTDNLQDVLADQSIDAVVIATPAKTHFQLVMASLESGKHVLVEKPMATDVREVEKIGFLASRNGLVAMVGHTFIYNPAVRFLRELIESNSLGDIRYIYSQRLNLGRVRSDIDALWNFAPHDVSIIQYVLGEPAPVFVTKHGMDYVQDNVNDVVFMNIVYPDKIMAHVHVSWLDPLKTRRMVVVGTQKMVVYDDIAENKIAIYDKGVDKMAVLGENMDFDDPDFLKFNHRTGDVLLPKIQFEEPLKVEISHFVECVKTGTACLTGPEHAKKVIEILAK